MTPTHTTRDGRPVTIDKTGKRWMRGWTHDGRTRWHLNGEHPRDEALDLTPASRQWSTWNSFLAKTPVAAPVAQPEPSDAEIERLRGMNAEFVAFFQNVRPWMGQTSREKFDTILARNGGKP